jgi:hypothetical protein
VYIYEADVIQIESDFIDGVNSDFESCNDHRQITRLVKEEKEEESPSPNRTRKPPKP